MLGFYHSHPDHPARPSETDRLAAWPFYSYVLVSIMKAKPAEMTSWTLYQETASVFLPAGHRLGAQNAVTAREILEETILVGDRCGGFAQNLVGITGFSLRLQRCNGTAAQMLDLVGAGLGIALLSDRLQVPPQLQTRRFTDPDLSRRILLTAVAGRPLNTAAASFIKLCRAQAYS